MVVVFGDPNEELASTTSEPFTTASTAFSTASNAWEIVDEDFALLQNVLDEADAANKERTFSGILNMFEFFASDQNVVFQSNDRLNYGCNCYGTLGGNFPDFDALPLGSPLDDYDKSCYDWKQCYERLRQDYPECRSTISGYQSTRNGDLSDLLADKSVSCSDAPCSCNRMVCECDAIFAKANTIAYENNAYQAEYSAMTYLLANLMNPNPESKFVHTNPDVCRASDVPALDDQTIPNFPCVNPIMNEHVIETTELTVTVYNFDHDFEEAKQFCTDQGKTLFQGTSEQFRAIAQLIADRNTVYSGDVRMWTLYEYDAVNGYWKDSVTNQRQCEKSMGWSACKATDSKPCVLYCSINCTVDTIYILYNIIMYNLYSLKVFHI